jgi:hypothetical protein
MTIEVWRRAVDASVGARASDPAGPDRRGTEAAPASHHIPNAAERPVVLTDGQDVDSASEMPNVRSKLADHGTTFNRTFATTPYGARAGPTKDPYWPRGEAERLPSQLNAQLKNLTRCSGADCRTADSNAFR